MNTIKRTILLILSMIPVQSIAFAAENALKIEKKIFTNEDIEREFLKLLNNNVLDDHFYKMLEYYRISNLEEFNHPDNQVIKNIILKRFKKDYLFKVDSLSSNPSGGLE